ncbi:endospore germination permease [Cohnella sp. CFH 77786]|uniref:GerAB/ArcD/ProY family transporter n=1 Tax=Cohnella sp. CFH 77786 TaxID=2662265 RepID=UPI001C609754
MHADEKISGYQLSLLLFTFIVSTLILSVPGIMVAFAKQNAWLSILPASLTGIVNIWVLTSLSKRHPGKSIIEYASSICGKWIGTIIGFYLTYYLFFFISSTVNEHAGFINIILLMNTPPLVSMATMLVLCGFVVLAGVEAIARCNEVILPVIILLLVPMFLLSLRDMDPARLTPILAEGILPVLKGSVVPSAWMSQFFFLGWFLPHLNEQPHRIRKHLTVSWGGVVLLVMTIDIITITVFGPITPRLKFAFFKVIQYIGILGSLERLETIAITIWILGIFIKISMLLYMFSLSASQLFFARNYRKTVLPVTLLSIVGSVWIFRSDAQFQAWITFTYPVLAFITQSLLPLLLLGIDVLRAKPSKSIG